MSGWTQVEPVSESGDTHSGAVSAKIDGEPGRVSQFIELQPDTEYTFEVYVKDQEFNN